MSRTYRACLVLLLAAVTLGVGSCASGGNITGAPPPVQAAVTGLALNPNAVQGNTPVMATVTLNTAAPTAGAVVQLTSSNNVVAPVPISVTVQAGMTTATFQILTTTVGTTQNVTITATLNGSVNAALTVTPVSNSVLQSFTVLPAAVLSAWHFKLG